MNNIADLTFCISQKAKDEIKTCRKKRKLYNVSNKRQNMLGTEQLVSDEEFFDTLVSYKSYAIKVESGFYYVKVDKITYKIIQKLKKIRKFFLLRCGR